MGIGKKIAMGIAGGLQGGAQGLQTGLNLEAQRKQAENQAMFAQAQAERVALEKAEMAEKAEGTARGHLFGIMSNIAKASPEDKKNIAKQFFPRIQELAPKAGWKPFSDENDLLSHVSIKELGDSYQTIYNARLEMPKILSGQVSPEVATGYFANAREAMNVQTRYTTDKGELSILEKDRANLDALEKTYLEKYAKKVEGAAPAAILGDKPVSKDTLDVLNKAGGIESTGQLGKDGLPIIGKKPEKPSKEDRLINQFRKTQVQKLSSDIVKNKIPELEKTLLDIDSEFAKFKRTPDGKIEIPGYGAGPNALPAWMLTAEGKKMRQKIGTAAELLLRQRSGAAINESEEKRLRGLAGVNPLQTEGEILTGLELIRNTATSVKEAISGGYSPDVLQEYLNNKQNAPKEFNPLSKGNEGKAVTITKEADDVFSFIGKGK